MSEYKFSENAYAKMIFHAAKYPYLAVNGILLADLQTGKGNNVHIVDAIPLFHQCLYLTPMLEIALQQIEQHAENKNLVIAGYYAAAENFYENNLDKAPAAKIADKIQEHFERACFVLLDNRLICMAQKQPAMHVYAADAENNNTRWRKAKYSLFQTQSTLEAVSALLRRGAMRDIVDFDNHLDNPENDWTNEFLNRDLQKIMAMY